jgi:hypothetical protein
MMKTISTKVDELVYSKLIESCNESGSCISHRIRELIEESFKSKQKDEFKSHYDKHGNHWTYDKDKQKWKCHVN